MDEEIIQGAFGKLQAAREAFLMGLPGRTEGLVSQFESSRDAGFPPGSLNGLRRQLASLNSASGVFGLPAIQTRASEGQALLERVIGSGPERAEAGWQRKLQSALGEIREESAAPPGVEGFRDHLKTLWGGEASLEVKSDILLLQAEDDDYSRAVKKGVEERGHRVERVGTLAGFESKLVEKKPAALLVNLDDLEPGIAPIHTLFTGRNAFPPPLFAISQEDDFQVRLQANRHGSARFHAKREGATALLDSLTRYLDTTEAQPLKVLVVEESRDLAEYATVLLYGSGMRVGLVAKPLEIRQSLYRFNPDLVIMDWDMACCSGLELSRIIRDEPGFSQTPILFLSGDALAFNRDYAASLGPNLLLPKPPAPLRLVRSVRFLHQETLIARKKGSSDPLTGHLSRDAFLERIDQELSRSRRTEAPFTVVVIEFIAYGGSQAERTSALAVLKRFGDVIKKTLRTTDVICRLEESLYSALLLDADQVGARRVLEKLQANWDEACREAGESGDVASLKSAGASFPAFTKSRNMLRAAEAALNSAKLKGGRQTVFASG
ncbi:MAG: response regulator [Magnetococcales bacterium]|nr:response regulator [Magnetococcales bacterium]